ncbi:hypothetical protein [Burkholderia dolosa]|uniref:hypothetical protein n=1 Tax=Burkholderia dolosa TaxID=152500 RepID=UPI001FC8571C|nr:hypothetical protein [Burkholderia dolosa]
MTGIIVRAAPLTTSATARVQWDGDSFTLSCDVCHATDNLTARSTVLRDVLDDRFGMWSETRRVVTTGSLTLTFNDAGRLRPFDLDINDDRWQKIDALPPVPVSPHAPGFSATFDALSRASVREPKVAYDDVARCLSFGLAQRHVVATASDRNLARVDVGGIALFQRTGHA